MAWPFENQYIWNPILKKSGFQMFLDFEWSDIRSPQYLRMFIHKTLVRSEYRIIGNILLSALFGYGFQMPKGFQKLIF